MSSKKSSDMGSIFVGLTKDNIHSRLLEPCFNFAKKKIRPYVMTLITLQLCIIILLLIIIGMFFYAKKN
jgi:hypothetical protein